MKGSSKWNWPQLREFKTREDVLEQLSQDPAGIAVATLCQTAANVKLIALGRDGEDRFYAPAVETITAQTYPLTRLAYVYVNRPPGKPLTPHVQQFLTYVLSDEGQQAVGRAGYLPLNAVCLEKQRARIR